MILGLSGRARSGKDTAAEILAPKLNGAVFALADPMKRFCEALFQLERDQLYGDKKEVLFKRSTPWAADCGTAFSRALNERFTPAELANRINFGRWLANLPPETTPRHILQTFGTECVRRSDYGDDFWVNHGLWVADELLRGGYDYSKYVGLMPKPGHYYSAALVTDVRFRNEMLILRRTGAKLMLIDRDAAQAGLSLQAKAHVSEFELSTIPRWWYDFVVENNGPLEKFEATLGGYANMWVG